MATLSQLNSLVQSSSTSPQDASVIMSECVGKLRVLKRKLHENYEEEQVFTKRIKARIQHLQQLHEIVFLDDKAFVEWSQVRLFRIILDYLMRKGYLKTSNSLIGSLKAKMDLEPLIDAELFVSSKRIEDSLKNHSCMECLQWCNENKSLLKKAKSTLEFNLRIQEFIELIRSRQPTQAIFYAKKHLSPWLETQMPTIQRAMSLLAFPLDTPFLPSIYQKLLHPSQWELLINQFQSDNFTLHNLTTHPLLVIALQSGLSALKTHQCYETFNKNIHCPCCASPMLSLAASLPYAHHINSCLVCRITGLVMDENNPPMVLPNGNVYSLKAINEMTETKGSFADPRSMEEFSFCQAKKAYVA